MLASLIDVTILDMLLNGGMQPLPDEASLKTTERFVVPKISPSWRCMMLCQNGRK
jgi:hypothetical protein